MDDSLNSRRIINVGAHQSTLLMDTNLEYSSSRHFDQAFDAQGPDPTSYYGNMQQTSQKHVTYAQQQVYHSTHDFKRSETEPIKVYDKNFSQTQSQQKFQAIQTQHMSERNHTIQQHNFDRNNSMVRQGTNIGMAGTVEINNRKVDLEPIMSTSQKFEDSVKDPFRLPTKVPGLIEFLVSEHQKRIGVYTKNESTLFTFWKKYVSASYRQKRKQELQQSEFNMSSQMPICTCPKSYHEQFKKKVKKSYKENVTNMNTSSNYQSKQFNCRVHEEFESAHQQSFHQQKSKNETNIMGMSKVSKKSIYEVEETKTQSIHTQYKLYENIYEMDVKFTIQKEIEEEHDEIKKTQLSKQFEDETKRKNDTKIKEEKEILSMMKDFYDDLREYEIQSLREKFEKLKMQEEMMRAFQPDWHKRQGLSESINPIESIEEEKREPKKPLIQGQPTDFDKERIRIGKEIEKEYNFMLNLLYMSREENLTNDPLELFQMYKSQKEKARMGVVWSKDDEDAFRVIKKFFQPEFFLKRLLLTFQKKTRYESQKNISLFGFYLQLSKSTRLVYMIDRKVIYKQQHQGKKEDEDKRVKDSVQEIIEEYETFEKNLARERMMMTQEDEFSEQMRNQKKLMIQVLGKEKMKKLEEKKTSIEDLAKPKDKWKRLNKLLELFKKFPHDIVLQRMVKEEMKDNRMFKYPEEYDLYDNDLERAFKIREAKTIKAKDLSHGKVLRETFKQLDGQELYYYKQKAREIRAAFNELERYIIESVHQYLESMKKRLKGQKQSVREFLAQFYQEMLKKFPQATKERFPHLNYGTKKDSATYKKSYPISYKRYFFKLLKSYVRTDKGLKRLKNPPPTFMMAGGHRCVIHEFGCPTDCQYATFNKKILLRTTLNKRRQREPGANRSKVWRRADHKNSLKDIIMQNQEIDNCTFEPQVGSLNLYQRDAIEAMPNLKQGDFFKEPDPEAYFEKLGKNFEKSNPEVYKRGVLKRAQLMYHQGKYEEAMNVLAEGFNLDSIRKRYDANYMKRFMAELLLKKKAERVAKEKEDQEKKGVRKMFLQKEEPESQKKRPEEDFENKNLRPVLQEVFDLLTLIEKHKHDANEQIRKIKNQQNTLKYKVSRFDTFKKSQTKVDLSRGEKIIFRTIMCPLKDKCSKIKKPRWPSSKTKSFTKFGEECPFAHHPMELKFPETLITKLSANVERIKNLEKSIINEEPKVFKPTGTLFDCIGCNQKSGKHIGGPCNLCRYKEMANTESKKFADPQKKESLMRSMERRESTDIKQERKEMSIIRKSLNLDDNYTRKFGLLKKACVLFFYGRYNDAFDEIAKAAKIIQDQNEVEQQKQKVIEKRWKFKLDLDDGFELPIPIEQIDPSKVDDKFLKKMDIQGVSLATLKLFIEQVSPIKTEEFSKHQYLNKCVEDLYLQCERAIDDKQETIKKMKKQVERLDEEADFADVMSSPERSPEKGGEMGRSMKIKRKKVKMCPELMKTGCCHLVKDKTKQCPYAHNPIELDLIPAETKIKNLNGVIQSQTIKMKNMKPLEPWKPANAGDIEHTHLMDMTSKKRRKDDEEDEDHKKEKFQKSIFERENILKKPYEKE